VCPVGDTTTTGMPRVHATSTSPRILILIPMIQAWLAPS
jgi:hypothetical protein